MFLRTSISSPPLQHCFSFSSETFQFPSHSVALPTHRNQQTNSIKCSVSRQPYGQNKKTVTVDRERKPWYFLYNRIRESNLDTSTELDQWVKEGKVLKMSDLRRIAKQFIKFRTYKLALEVYEWMNDQGNEFSLYHKDAGIELDLVSKVRGISSAKEYFSKLPESLKNYGAYTSLLNAYVKAKMKEDAESLMNEIKDNGYAIYPFPYNLMMTLYMKLKDFDKVISMVSEMIEKNVKLDICSYNIWLTTCGNMGSIERMEAAIERMKLDTAIEPNWTTYSTTANAYINLGEVQKAKSSLRMVEAMVTGYDRIPFHHLLGLYGRLGEKEEVCRIWNIYKESFPYIYNLGYSTMIGSLLRCDDIGGAEKFYYDWMSVRSSYDPKLANLLVGWYVRNGMLQKAEFFLDSVIEKGGKANSYTWELLAQGHIKEEKIPEALACMKEASSMANANYWRPKPKNIASFLSLCEKESDMASKEAFVELLRKLGGYNESHISFISSNGAHLKFFVNKDTISRDDNDDDDDDDDDGTDLFFNQLEEAL